MQVLRTVTTLQSSSDPELVTKSHREHLSWLAKVSLVLIAGWVAVTQAVSSERPSHKQSMQDRNTRGPAHQSLPAHLLVIPVPLSEGCGQNDFQNRVLHIFHHPAPGTTYHANGSSPVNVILGCTCWSTTFLFNSLPCPNQEVILTLSQQLNVHHPFSLHMIVLTTLSNAACKWN